MRDIFHVTALLREGPTIILLVLFEIVLPLGLALWFFVLPSSNWLTFGLLSTAAALVSSALILTGLWTVLPWWWPWLCAAAALVGAGRNALTQKSGWWPRGWHWAASAAALGIAAIGGWFTVQGLAGRRSTVSAIDLKFPLPPGRYLIANGGANLAVSSHAETLDLSVPRHRLWYGQSYGIDIVALNSAGRSASGLIPGDPKSFAIYGRTVLAPCSGMVVAVLSGLPDSPIPLTGDEPSAGNHILLRCGRADILLAHFKPSSLRVRAGERVEVSQPVAEVGNSGSSSEPHLHIHAQTPGTAMAPFSGTPLPIRFDGRAPVRNVRF